MQSILSHIEYRADGQIIAATFGNGLSETRIYDQQGRLVHQDLKDDTGLIVDERVYEYDPAGNITARTGTPGDQHYSYDALDRLIGQDIAADNKDWQYDYGPNHNRQTRTDGDLLEELYSYQPDTNRLNEIDKLLDAPDSGIPTSRQFIYNQANRFAEYIEDGQTVASYTYNALGQRTRKELETESTLFHYDTGIQLLSETDETGILERDYLWLGARPVAQIESTGMISYLYTDHLLTPRLGTSGSQKVIWHWEGEAFGDIEASGPVQVDLRFPGQYFDGDTQQHYNSFRDYGPNLGRYIQSDPIGQRGGRNTFVYVDANPLAWIDKFGLAKFCCRVLGNFIPGTLLGKKHCYVRDNSGTTHSLFPKNGRGIPTKNDPSDSSGQCFDCPANSCDESQDQCLANAHNSYPRGDYDLLGPNSNTYAGTLARACCKGGVPGGVSGAPGINDDPPNEDG